MRGLVCKYIYSFTRADCDSGVLFFLLEGSTLCSSGCRSLHLNLVLIENTFVLWHMPKIKKKDKCTGKKRQKRKGRRKKEYHVKQHLKKTSMCSSHWKGSGTDFSSRTCVHALINCTSLISKTRKWISALSVTYVGFRNTL